MKMTRRLYLRIIREKGRKVAYNTYIASETWGETRQKRKAIDKGECRGCGSTEHLEVHHKWPKGYANIPHEDIDNDLTTLCHDCHTALHSLYDGQRYQGHQIKPNHLEEIQEKELINYGMVNSELQINGSITLNPSQRRFGKSVEQDHEGTKENIGQAWQDRSRFRGVGKT